MPTTPTLTPTYDTGARGKTMQMVSHPPERALDDQLLNAELPDTDLDMVFRRHPVGGADPRAWRAPPLPVGQRPDPEPDAALEVRGVRPRDRAPRGSARAAHHRHGRRSSVREPRGAGDGGSGQEDHRIDLRSGRFARRDDGGDGDARRCPPGGGDRSCQLDGARPTRRRAADEHLEWARQTRTKMVVLQAKHPTASNAVAKGEELMERVKQWFAQ